MTHRVCTIAAVNYLASVELLAASLRRHHPELVLTVLVVDGHPDDVFDGLPFDVVLPAALGLPAGAFAEMATYYDATELSTALKPFFLQHLLAEGDDVVMYLDPDIEVFASLDDLFALGDRVPIVLTAHVTQPMPRDGLHAREEAIFLSGQFNLGFIVVNRRAHEFLEYWGERTMRYALRRVEAGYFTDQRWIDAVPVFYEHEVVRDLGCNVAYWNLHERTLAVDERGVWTAGGATLRFFHFSGHDADDPLEVSRHVAQRPRVVAYAQPALRRLLLERAQRMTERRGGRAPAPYRFERTPNGVTLHPWMRRLYWETVVEAEERGEPLPPAAFAGDGGQAFLEWIRGPILPGNPVSRHLLAVWKARPDLQYVFPEPFGPSAVELEAWSRDEAAHVPGTAATLVSVTPARGLPLRGVNLVGYLKGEFGVAGASRMVLDMVHAAGVPLAVSVLSADVHRHRNALREELEGAPFDLSLLAVNADALIGWANTSAFAPHGGRPRVGIWYWEVGLLPAEMRRAFDLVDEVWCSTDHVRSALAPCTDKPVRVHPIVINPAPPTALLRSDLGLPDDRFLFAFAFDHLSVMRRKNPHAVVRAYAAAFGPDDGAGLVIKSINAPARARDAAELREIAGDRPDISFVDGHLDAVEMSAWFQHIDCYVSLHRSEGLGLTLATAMGAGKPVIATGWSGNLEFMTTQNSVLVPYELVEVGHGSEPYPSDASWADPDEHAAAEAMRAMFDDPSAARELGERGRADVLRHDRALAADWFWDRYSALTGHAA